MIHLTLADYRLQRWKNGKGTTTELWRHEETGRLIARLSVATVAEDGPFSLFPGIARSLTVIDGPGFRLAGPGFERVCAPLTPVAFSGDLAVTATGTEAGPSRDFNVMTDAACPPPEVSVLSRGALPPGGRLALFAPFGARIDGGTLAPMDLILTDAAARVLDGPVIAARLFL
jgi:uncharacterized protein